MAGSAQIERPAAHAIALQRGVGTQDIRDIVNRDAQRFALLVGAGDAGLLVVAQQTGHRRHAWCGGINGQFVGGVVGDGIADAITATRDDAVDTSQHGLR